MYELSDDQPFLPESQPPAKVKSYQQQAYDRLRDKNASAREAKGQDPLSPFERREREQTLLAQHSTKSQEHYTPTHLIEPARELMGSIDLDPASNWLAQDVVKATAFYGWHLKDKAEPVLLDGLGAAWSGNVFLNPPGGDTSKVRPEVKGYSRSYPLVWWGKLMSEYEAGNVKQAIFIAFQLNLWANSQSLPCPSMLDFPYCITKKRVRFHYPEDTHEGLPTVDTQMVESKAPPGFSAIVYLPPKDRPQMEMTFGEMFSDVGEVMIP